jgi:anti-anti-sigma regulatory factor/anti-sigma regulatory factor (Ser/Thr protein kinase)
MVACCLGVTAAPSVVRWALMSERISFEVDLDPPVITVRARGVLDSANAAELRAALVECLADQPTGVVVDVSELAVVDELALSVFVTAAQESQRWPGTRIAVGGLAPDIAPAVERMGIARYVMLTGDSSLAVSGLRSLPQPPTYRLRVAPDRDAPGLARQAVQDFCERHQVTGDGDAAHLVASELVTNAVVHAGTAIDMTLRIVSPLLHIAVRDGSASPPRMAIYMDESAETGRGLLLVDALACEWGSLISRTGKVVWAAVRTRPLPAGDHGLAGARIDHSAYL